MSKARPQSSKRRAQRVMFGLQSQTNSTKKQGMRLQAIDIYPKRKKGRPKKGETERLEWLKKLSFHIGKTKFIYHKPQYLT